MYMFNGKRLSKSFNQFLTVTHGIIGMLNSLACTKEYIQFTEDFTKIFIVSTGY